MLRPDQFFCLVSFGAGECRPVSKIETVVAFSTFRAVLVMFRTFVHVLTNDRWMGAR